MPRLPANGLPQRVRPSSVTFGDSFPRWGSLFVQQNAPDRSVRGVLPVMLVEEVIVEGDTEVVGDGAQLVGEAVERGEPLGRTENTLTDLLAQYCGAELTVAIADALARGVPHPNAVRLVLERQRRAQDEPPPLTITLPEHVNIDRLVIRPRAQAANWKVARD